VCLCVIFLGFCFCVCESFVGCWRTSYIYSISYLGLLAPAIRRILSYKFYEYVPVLVQILPVYVVRDNFVSSGILRLERGVPGICRDGYIHPSALFGDIGYETAGVSRG
jgi:hypothetical protein